MSSKIRSLKFKNFHKIFFYLKIFVIFFIAAVCARYQQLWQRKIGQIKIDNNIILAWGVCVLK